MTDEIVSTDDSVSVDWRRLAEIGVAAVVMPILAFAVGLVDLIAGGVARFIAEAAHWYDVILSTLWGIPAETISAAATETTMWIDGSGILGFLFAIGIVVAAGWVAWNTIEWLIDIAVGVLNL